jgi:integrase
MDRSGGRQQEKPKKKRQKTAPWDCEGIRIRPIENRSGRYSYRVEVPESVTGKRILKQFKTTEEAEAYAGQMVVKRKNSGLSAFTLTDSQRSDAHDALKLLSDSQCEVNLKQLAEFFIKHARPAAGDITVSELSERYRQAKERKGLRPRSLSDLKYRLGVFGLTFGSRLMKEIQAAEIEEWLFVDPTSSSQTRRNFRTVLMGFFKYAVTQKYLATNPLLAVTNPVVEDAQPGILTVKQSWALLNTAMEMPELELLPYVALGLFCGVRSDELARLDWNAVDLEAGHVTIGPKIAKKRRIRIIDIPECCRAWLLASGTKQQGGVRPLAFQKRWKILLAAADRYEVDAKGNQVESVKPHGLVPWPANALRHSAASYHYTMHSDAAKTCAMLGQKDDTVLFDHYRSLVKSTDAKKFYELTPPRSAPSEKIVALHAVR